MTASSESRYVPAAGRRGLTAIYDAAMALTMREHRWRPALTDRICASVPTGGTIIDLGAGTGTLTIAIAQRRPDCRVIGVDGDEQALAIARRKAGSEHVEWQHALAGRELTEEDSADAVVMSLLLHHLDRPDKLLALKSASGVLRASGTLFIADWGRPQDPTMHLAFAALRLVDGRGPTADHAAGRLPQLIQAAGFRPAVRRQRLRTVWGNLEQWEAAPNA